MNYGELRTYFLGVLNRDDCDDNLADLFISMGLRRASRVLRLPIQRKVLTITVTDLFPGWVNIPTDYLGMISVNLDDVPVQRITNGQKDQMPGYYFRGGLIYFEGNVRPDQVISIEYYADFPELQEVETHGFTTAIPDVIVYASLVFAASYFVDDRKEAFNQDFVTLAEEVQMMADVDALTGAVVSPYGGGIA